MMWSAVVLGLFLSIGATEAGSCFTFDTAVGDWVPGYPSEHNWKFSADGDIPNTATIPAFVPTLGYTWFQYQLSPPAISGNIQSPSIILYDGSQVALTAFRHIVFPQLNDTYRPELSFITGPLPTSVVLQFTEGIYDAWSTYYTTCVSVITGPQQTVCCPSGLGGYPCPGILQLDGVVYGSDELLAVDRIAVDDPACH